MAVSPGAAPIRPASTVLLVRDGAAGLEVFMVRRHQAIDFASGAMVFPGGKLGPGDSDPSIARLCRGAETLSGEMLPFAVAAIREAFEEAGILLARPRGEPGLVDQRRLAALESYRARLERDEIAMAAFLEREGLELALDALAPFARWITPGVMPKRFDTWFFLALAPANQTGRHDGAEAVDSLWMRPEQAIAGADARTLTVVFATRMNLLKLGQSPTAAAAMAAARQAPIVPVEPQVDTGAPGGGVLRIPPEAGYGISEWPLGRISG